jgi:diguanylate cyclase (GGDEF)-like protein
MAVPTDLLENLKAHCSRKTITPQELSACCQEILQHFKFDCVFLARSAASEDLLSPLVFDGKEEVMETCLYRLGVEERIALSKLPLKTYMDMTGKPVFNKAGSLRIQKPNSGVFMVHYRSKSLYLLFGCAHQNSQAYDSNTLGELSGLWKAWQESLVQAVDRLSAPAPLPEPVKIPAPVLEVPRAKPKVAALEEDNDGRRPVILVDEETRLFNKEYFSECLSIEVERAKRYSRLMSLMFLSVTPVEGAASSGNENLIAQQVAEILIKSLRRVDVICRLEKHKYGLILPDTANNTYGIIAKRIFKHFKQVMGDAPPIYLNISASTFPKHAETHHALLDHTERLLQQAKEVGPNKAVLPE